jgi:hypothetical protein
MRLAAVVSVLCAGVALAALVQLGNGAGHPPGISLVGVAAGGDQGRFTISGKATGLYPGASLPLVLTVSNPQQFTIDVTSITTTVGNASPSCPASLLTVTSFSGDLLVPGQSKATHVVTATLSHATPDACQGVVFPIVLFATATRP